MINFNEVALKTSEEDYNKVKFTSEKSQIIQEIAKFLHEIIRIPELAIKGITYKALTEWQIKNDKTIMEITEMPIGKRLNVVKEIFNIGKKIMKGMLRDPNDESEIMIDIAFEKAFKYFLEYFNRNCI